MKRLAALALSVLLSGLSGGQTTVIVSHRQTLGCTPPAMSYRWAAYNPSTICSGGCTTGNAVTSSPDFVAGNLLTDFGSPFGSPTYQQAAVNGLPAFNFVASSNMIFSIATGCCGPGTTSIAAYGIGKSNCAATGRANCAFLGATTVGNIDVGMDSGNHVTIVRQDNATITSGSTVLSTAQFFTAAYVYNYGTGVATVYLCHGGACTQDGTGTTVVSPSQPLNAFGGTEGLNWDWNGQIAEVGVLANGSSASLPAIAAWSQCKYGI